MSFTVRKKVVEEGDTIILYLNVNNLHAIEVATHAKNKKNQLIEKVFQTSFGALKIKDLIGHEYGTKVQLSRGWGYVLQPTPELWTVTLPHRTQIIYTPDISMIIFQLEIKSGSTVIESGTGSGSLSHAFIRAVAPHGHLYTFDFHEVRTVQAREEFENHGYSKYVTVTHRDVCGSGFSPELNGKADAVFLDLPLPWEAIEHATKTFKVTGGRFCSFSPCIEQTQKTCNVLTQFGYSEITTMEILQTDYNVITRSMPVMNLDILKLKKTDDVDDENVKDKEKEVIKILTAATPVTQPGHTGYLVFATYLPSWAR
ncbi:tRNA (adenine(58)-N(1))-methyltransferase catalytic subunit TRMT61A [Ctenocephalides felis]|uniref:tRNA (adenine(58)-N(1))-methyltransferase catalytic subunit TRMT61A n=1 Tax=Ctenocephalides felis TaxID=7515 RepID=UPI000E6E579E|nr:tRNA (adenine(58)-N(1))-methyltransferase catalytic subunit TRMT61A [Ctenocephalides felis]